MFRKYIHHSINWYDFKHPNEPEFLEIARVYKIDKELIRKFLSPKVRNEIILKGRTLFVSLVFLEETKKKVYNPTPLRFILGHNFILSGRECDVTGFYEIKKVIKSQPKTDALMPNAPFLELLTRIYSDIENRLDQAEDEIEALHDLLDKQKDIWESEDRKKFEEILDIDTAAHAKQVFDHYQKVYGKAIELKSAAPKKKNGTIKR